MSGTLPVRVMVSDAWDAVSLDLPSSTAVSEIKREALARTRVMGDPGEYLVKFRGAELDDETRSLKDAGVPANASLIVLRRRRRPVR
ncbi:MAG TPA: hypothetical protein VIE46_04665 [Gemmatimonadales bacterium]|jgi:hypothetical protein